MFGNTECLLRLFNNKFNNNKFNKTDDDDKLQLLQGAPLVDYRRSKMHYDLI